MSDIDKKAPTLKIAMHLMQKAYEHNGEEYSTKNTSVLRFSAKLPDRMVEEDYVVNSRGERCFAVKMTFEVEVLDRTTRERKKIEFEQVIETNIVVPTKSNTETYIMAIDKARSALNAYRLKVAPEDGHRIWTDKKIAKYTSDSAKFFKGTFERHPQSMGLHHIEKVSWKESPKNHGLVDSFAHALEHHGTIYGMKIGNKTYAAGSQLLRTDDRRRAATSSLASSSPPCQPMASNR